MPYRADERPASGPMLEAWSVLTGLAMATTTVELGTLVLGMTYRHPCIVANMAATLDHVSGGRLVLGLGAGWQVNEHVAYGIPLPEVGARLSQFAEACAIIRGMLRGESPTVDGQHYRTVEARCEPLPVQARLPILIGGGGERRTLRIVARFADEWHAWATPAEFRHKNAVLDQHCADIGRDPSSVRRLTGQAVRITAHEPRPSFDTGSDVVGLPVSVAAQLDEYERSGVDEFIVRDDAKTPLGISRGQLSWLVDILSQRGCDVPADGRPQK
jgi:alkanesulfonate monooxygenase SsuD/methylene tetrahydromethanopterin reductase-like flavin-dependent oxidoreductase (luciferase family)